jgi:hypothetical protein
VRKCFVDEGGVGGMGRISDEEREDDDGGEGWKKIDDVDGTGGRLRRRWTVQRR